MFKENTIIEKLKGKNEWHAAFCAIKPLLNLANKKILKLFDCYLNF